MTLQSRGSLPMSGDNTEQVIAVENLKHDGKYFESSKGTVRLDGFISSLSTPSPLAQFMTGEAFPAGEDLTGHDWKKKRVSAS